MIRQEKIILDTEDHAQFALWKISDPERSAERHVLMIHGTFSDKRICLKFAEYLVEYGYICWILEWRGHGSSPQYHGNYNFETVALYEIKSAVKYLIDHENIQALYSVNHSGGGVGLSMMLARNPQYQPYFKAASFFACQSFSAANTRKRKAKLIALKLLSKSLGVLPGKQLGIGPQNESYYMMNQWFNWNIQQRFVGDDQFDYCYAMKSIRMPIYSIASIADDFIAPPEACQMFLDQFENSLSKFECYSLANGNLEDYSHSRIFQSQNAKKEIWPKVIAWLEKFD